jgi:DNA-binding transcriptional regulator YiaG
MLSESPAFAIKAFRQAQALSQEGLARVLGVSVRTVARWESGLSRPSSLAMEKLRQVTSHQSEAREANGT